MLFLHSTRYKTNSYGKYSKYSNGQRLQCALGHCRPPPVVNVLEGSQVKNPIPNCLKNFGMYVVFLKDVICADYLKYGRQEYDFQENTLVFVSPGQVLGHPADGSTYQAKGWCLYFSPELLHGTQLGRHMKDYSFFSYDVHEALHLSLQERETIIDCLKKIDDEINNGADKHSNTIIASAIELFLNYCNRFYDRQFITRKKANKDILARFEELLNGYFASEKPQSYGTPSVAYFAGLLHLSANYFGDLIKKETGRCGLEYVQQKIMDTAKDMLADPKRASAKSRIRWGINTAVFQSGVQKSNGLYAE